MIIFKFFIYLFTKGLPLTMMMVCIYMQKHFSKVPAFKKVFYKFGGYIRKFQVYLDKKYDNKHGVDTSGIIQIKDYDIKNNHNDSNGYQATPEKTFDQIMNKLVINFREFTFIDYGSGKGRVLLMASKYGFKKIIGIEFDKNLHLIAEKNIHIYQNRINTITDIESICCDARCFSLPDGQLLIFFFSPFKGEVLSSVVANISTSFSLNHNTIIVIFLGTIMESIERLRSLNFKCSEIELGPDWTRFRNYRCVVFTSQRD